ncbi:MAG: hypothetical protein ACI81R_002424 [Bradymonadia bacterium]|jgi:hypothetical protein
MQFTIRDTVPFPRDRVFSVQRDKLDEIAPFLDRIESIRVDSREEDGNIVHMVNYWRAESRDIPKVAQAFIKPEMMRWIDRATWDGDAFTCSWDMELGFLPGAIEARGVNHWVDAGEVTHVEISGEIIIHANKIRGVPRLLSGKVGSAIEKFVIATVEPNLRKTNEAVARYIRQSD